jgi:hypothetical protein
MPHRGCKAWTRHELHRSCPHAKPRPCCCGRGLCASQRMRRTAVPLHNLMLVVASMFIALTSTSSAHVGVVGCIDVPCIDIGIVIDVHCIAIDVHCIAIGAELCSHPHLAHTCVQVVAVAFVSGLASYPLLASFARTFILHVRLSTYRLRVHLVADVFVSPLFRQFGPTRCRSSSSSR